MKYVRISEDVWVNLDEVESITRNLDGTALIQGRMRVYQSVVPIDAILMETHEHKDIVPVTVQSPLIARTEPAW